MRNELPVSEKLQLRLGINSLGAVFDDRDKDFIRYVWRLEQHYDCSEFIDEYASLRNIYITKNTHND